MINCDAAMMATARSRALGSLKTLSGSTKSLRSTVLCSADCSDTCLLCASPPAPLLALDTARRSRTADHAAELTRRRANKLYTAPRRGQPRRCAAARKTLKLGACATSRWHTGPSDAALCARPCRTVAAPPCAHAAPRRRKHDREKKKKKKK
jgi:hypothetical protein